MKKLLLLFIPLMFFFSCELFEEEEEVCTGNATSDLVVGTWETNTIFYYYTNGDLYNCVNVCNSSNNLCVDNECITSTYNCDGTYTNSLGESGTWSYDPQGDVFTSIGPQGTFYYYPTTLNSTHMVMEADLVLVEENGNQFNVLAISSATRQ
tara:strand:+ start:162 stop:617 length:456 start_codon:yes stop_codon:yes gene_type:complete